MNNEFIDHGKYSDRVNDRFRLPLRNMRWRAKRGQKLEWPNGDCRNNKRSGAAVVEFAVVAPLLLLLVLGTIEYGRFVMVQQVLTNAAREGARQAVIDGSSSSSVVQVVSDYCTDAQVAGVTVTVSTNPSVAAPGLPITVTAQTSFDQVSWFPAPIYLQGAIVSASSTMRREEGI